MIVYELMTSDLFRKRVFIFLVSLLTLFKLFEIEHPLMFNSTKLK
jgi:hypothetical protein